jgi:potassium-transporting ATPase potassium-binding subunit
MTANDWIQLVLYFVVLIALAIPLGRYMAQVLSGEATWISRAGRPVERLLYRLAGVGETDEMSWSRYATAFMVFSVTSFAVVYLLQRGQALLPLNPAGFAAVDPALAFNTAISFASNTNWQAYGGESTLSYLSQALALGVQNFVSAAAGIAVVVALIRGFARAERSTIGNFWVDLTRTTLYILLPLSLVYALLLVSQGVVQTWHAYPVAELLEPLRTSDTTVVSQQAIAVGPAASQVAIKQLGTNGGGFFNANSAHPFENPTPLSNFLEMLAILLIPAGLCEMFGRMVRDRRQGWVVLAAMTVILVPLTLATTMFEQAGTPVLAAAGADQVPSALQAGGNMEGKEARFGIVNSAIWASATTAASNGSVNAMHDSFTPLGGLVPLWLIQFGEVVFGGVGSGLYGMLVFALIAVFIAGLMVGRTPEYLGKKIEAYEVKMASLVILIPAMMILLGTALAVSTDAGRAGVFNPGAHGFSEILYAVTSAVGNNGSAFGGLGANSTFYNVLLGICMWVGRFWLAIPVLAIAGALARKKLVPAGAGTLPTNTPLFAGLLVGTVLLVGALTFVPALALGPIVEHFQLFAR